MCNLKDNLSRYTSYYKSPDDIEHFKFRIRLKEEVPDADMTLNHEREEKWHIQEFRWQEKHFNKIERTYYSDINRCLTDFEKTYHEQISNNQTPEETIFFSYINQDSYNIDDNETNINQNHLVKLMENTELVDYRCNKDEYDFEKSLSNAVENRLIPNEVEKMYVLADLGEYIEDVWIRNDVLLCVIKYDKIFKVLTVFPDFTTTKPYILKIEGQTLRYIHYFLENSSSNGPDREISREIGVLRKISEKKMSLTKEITGEEFFLPPKNKLYIYLFFDILSAKGFEYGDLFIQYFIDLPNHWNCENTTELQGVTSICHSKDEETTVHFGHNFDVILEYDIQSLQDTTTPKTPCIFFQVISKSSWERYRSEGVAYQHLPISRPGCYFFDSSCYRFDTQGYSGKLRRYFIGDAYNYRDIRWIGPPVDENEKSTFNKFGVHTIGSGEIKFRLNVLHQSQAFLREFNDNDNHTRFIYEKLNSSSLIRSVNQVLQAFKKARRKMYEIKKYL